MRINEDETRNLLQALADATKQTIDTERTNGALQPEEEVFFHWKVNQFSYDDNGISNHGARGENVTKPSWLRAQAKLDGIIKQTNEYKDALNQLTSILEIKQQAPNYLERFLGKLIHGYLSSEGFGDSSAGELITTFIKDLKKEPLKCGAEVELQGIVLRPDEIELSHGIILRKPRVEDLEKAFPVYSFMPSPHLSNPSAYLKIEFLGKSREIQQKVDMAITILRLFKPGSIKWFTYRMYSESITEFFGGTMTSGDQTYAIEKYLVREEDAKSLINFWDRISYSIPNTFLETGTGKIDHIAIAYNRYSDSLLQSGIMERRIANAIMGLEALFLKSGAELQELQYRLSLRVAKLLADFSQDPIQVKKTIKDAYKIRSIFTHGGQLSYKEKTKFESKYKELRNLLLSVLDYLRISLIISMTIKIEKDEFIDVIDDSFIHEKNNERLKGLINSAKYILESK